MSTGHHYKNYELSNHLGNVLSIITDQKLPQDTNIDLTIDYYTANVIHAQDYYPFGMLMPGRQVSIRPPTPPL